MRPRAAVTLVARREIVERVRDRSLAISTAVTIAILAALIGIPALLDLDGERRFSVVAAGAQAERVAERARSLAPSFAARIEIVRAADDAAVRRLVKADDGDAGLLADGAQIVVREELDDTLGVVLQESSRQDRLRERPPPPLPVSVLEPATNDADELQGIAFLAMILLYGQLIGYGYWLASGIVEEKSSRVVELLLATIRPSQLLAGKIIGIGVVGLAQLLVIATAGLALGIATSTVTLPADAAGAVATVLAWFVLGYAVYACMFATAAAIVARQEELQSSTGPLMVLVLGAWMVSFPALQDPAGGLATVLSFVPVTAPMVAPVRMIAGDMPVVQIVGSAAVLLVAVALLVRVAARVYSNAILRTGRRVSLRDAWRAAQV